MKYSLSISGKHYNELKDHLFPGDSKEAVAVALCGRKKHKKNVKLLVHELIPIPYSECYERSPYIVNWSTQTIIPHLEKAAKKGLAILKIHSHPTGFPSFSDVDDASDLELFESVFGWMDTDEPHASAVMLPKGDIFGRIFNPDLSHRPINKVTIAGDDLKFWYKGEHRKSEEFERRTAQAFGEGTTSKLKNLKIGVVGCSGTGSPVIEQLTRLGVGSLVLVDPDCVEEKNLNRIVNSTMQDAISASYKVDVLKRAIGRIGLGTQVTTFTENIYDDRNVINELATCDVLIGCVDSVDGRHLLNHIATFYLIPYFDLGIKLISDGEGGIDQILGSIHYLQPGCSSLRTRGVYNEEELRAASLYRIDPQEYEEQKKSGYIVDVDVDSPAVVSINSQIASMAVNELLARLHPFRYDSNAKFAITRISFTDSYIQHEKDGAEDEYLKKYVGRGDITPLLNISELG